MTTEELIELRCLALADDMHAETEYAAALDAVVVEVERLRAERDEARQLLRDCWIAAGLLNENWTGVPDLIAEIEDLVTCAKYLDEAEDELVRTRKLAAGLAERVAAQSELLARAAAKVPAEPIPTLWGAVS